MDLKVNSSQPKSNINNYSQPRNLRPIEDEEGDELYVQISNFNTDGSVRIYGNYDVNYFDIPKYDLKPIKVLDNDEVDFEFILSIKETIKSTESIFYTSKYFYNKLKESYLKDSENFNPQLTNSIITQEKIVVIVLDGLKSLITDSHIRELNTFLGNEPVIVSRNIFESANYGESPNFELNPTYDLDKLVEYINWVVSKPSQDYNNRLIDAHKLGDWKSITSSDTTLSEDDGIPTNDEPSYNTDDNKSHPPFNRKGVHLYELVKDESGKEFYWSGDKWVLLNK